MNVDQVYAVYTEHDYVGGQYLYGIFTTSALADEYVRNQLLKFLGKFSYACCARVTLDDSDNDPEELFFYRYEEKQWVRVTS